MFTDNRKTVKIFIFIILIILILIVFRITNHFINYYETITTVIPHNVYLNESNIEGKGYSEAQKLINKLNNEKLNRKINIKYRDSERSYNYEYSFKDLGIKTNVDSVLNDIKLIVGKGDSIKEKINNYKESKNKKMEFDLEYIIDDEKLQNSFKEFENITLKTPVNAELRYENGEVIIIGGEEGLEFDKEKLLELVMEGIYSDNNIISINYPTNKIDPEITIDEMKEQNHFEMISSFTTEYDYENEPRSVNLRVATNTINGTLLAPDESFSLNEIVGERTSERGYKVAAVFANGKITRGLGGGLCQVATTLYNSLLFSNIEIIERDHHSLTVGYVPLSRDSAISWGIQDLKFKNNTGHYIYIEGRVEDKTMTFDIFGTKNENIEIKLETVVHSVIEPPIKEIPDSSLPKGTTQVISYGRTGYKSSLYKTVYKDGKIIENSKVHTDVYGTLPKTIKIGTKED